MRDDLIDAMSKSLRNAWQLGQTYFAQADSESYSQNLKSDETQKKFEALIEDTRLFIIAATAPEFGNQPAPQGVAEVMEQAQVFASAWALIGGRFDRGTAVDLAKGAEAELRAMVITLVQERDALRAEKSGPYFGHYQQSLTKIARLDARVAELEDDAARLDWLEAQINKHGAIHLHDGNNAYGLGLGLRPGSMVRTLRYAIDDAKGPHHG